MERPLGNPGSHPLWNPAPGTGVGTDGKESEMSVDTLERPVDESPGRTSYRRRRWGLAALVAVVAAAGAFAFYTRPVAPVLVSDGAGTISSVDLDTGAARFTATNAVRAADGSRIYRTEEADGATVVEVLDPESGDIVASTSLGAKLEIRAVSPLGGAAALMAPRPPGGDLYVPSPREVTSINVVWLDGREAANYTLKGNFEPETFSTDESTLFLLEFYPATAPDRYFVRQLDLTTGEITEVTTPDQEIGIELNPEMRGHARAQAMAPDGSYLFSLYTIGQDEAPVHDPADPGTDRWAFVHTLNLVEKWSHCIFLPLPFGTGVESALSLGIAGDGRDLFVVDASTEAVARIDARKLQIDAVEVIPGLASSMARPLAVGPEIVYIGMDHSVLEMGRETLIPNAAFVVNQSDGWLPITGLELAPDGRTLRVAHHNTISVLDMPTEKVVATLTSPGRTGASFLGDPVGDRTELSLEWVIPGG